MTARGKYARTIQVPLRFFFGEDMGRNAINLTGQRFDKLTVIRKVTKNQKPMWLCRCECGNEIVTTTSRLRSGHNKSCGCLLKEHQEKLFGQSNSRLYHIWQNMKSRCYNPEAHNYKYYGGEGVAICDDWQDFRNFYLWAINNGYADNLTIERKDSNKGYSPENCRWATQKEQANNKRNNRLLTYGEKTQTLSQWADEYNISPKTLHTRLNKLKWSIEKALTSET